MPLIVAVALFMENMDSTVIATSLPAIAADIGTNPLSLKLALTSYLLSLAVFIPMSGWTADRFGARTVFAAAIAVFMLGSIGCAMSASLPDFVIARILQGMGGAMMTPVGRLVLVRSIDKRELVNAMAWVTVPALIGPVIGPPVGGFITTYASWHWIFLINIPIGLIGIALTMRFIDPVRADDLERFDGIGMLLASLGVAGLAFGLSVAGLDLLPWTVVVALIGGGAVAMTAYVFHARKVAAPPLDFSCALSDLPRRAHRRLSVSPRHRRAAVPAAADAADRFRHDAVSVRPCHLRHRRRRARHEDGGGAHHRALRLPAGPDRVDATSAAIFLAACAVFTPGDAAIGDLPRAADRRILPLAGIHLDQHHRLCRRRSRANSPAPPR